MKSDPINSLEVTFNSVYKPISWFGQWANIFGPSFESSEDIRTLFPFLHCSESILTELSDDLIENWIIPDITIKSKKYNLKIVKMSKKCYLLTAIDNQTQFLQRSLEKQKMILNDPFHWTKININKSDDLEYLTKLANSLEPQLSEMELSISKLLNFAPLELNKELTHVIQLTHRAKYLISTSKKYIKLRSSENTDQ